MLFGGNGTQCEFPLCITEGEAQGKINVRLKQSNHSHNYNLRGFDTIKINLVSIVNKKRLWKVKNFYMSAQTSQDHLALKPHNNILTPNTLATQGIGILPAL